MCITYSSIHTHVVIHIHAHNIQMQMHHNDGTITHGFSMYTSYVYINTYVRFDIKYMYTNVYFHLHTGILWNANLCMYVYICPTYIYITQKII